MPLSNIRVVDAATIMAGPLIATNLGDFGADVIKIEHPKKRDNARAISLKKDDVPLMWKWLARNKRTIDLDFKDQEDKEIFLNLIKTTDILIENFRPGTLEKWGLGYDVLSEINPKLILIRVTGYGQTGPYSKRPGFGTIAEAMSGYAHMTGYPDGPPTLPPFGLADSITGLNGTYAALIALFEREFKSGKGQVIDLSILESMFALLGSQASDYHILGKIPQRVGNRAPFTAPRNLYKTKDNKYVCISGSAQSIAERIFKIIGREDLIDHPKFRNNDVRVKNADELDEIIGAWMIQHEQQEIIAKFANEEAALGPVYDISDIFKDPHFIDREMVIEVEDPQLEKIKMQNIVPRFSRTPGKIRSTGKEPGVDNQEILAELGYSEEQIASFLQKRRSK